MEHQFSDTKFGIFVAIVAMSGIGLMFISIIIMNIVDDIAHLRRSKKRTKRRPPRRGAI